MLGDLLEMSRKIEMLEKALEVAEKYFNIIAKDQSESDIAIYGRDENGDLAEIAIEKIKAIKEGVNNG